MAGICNILNKNRQAIDQERLRYAIHHGTEHRLETDFIGERAAEFDQRAAIVQAIAIEEAIEACLNPFTERLEQKRSNNNGDDAADGTVGLRMEDLRDERHKEEINRGDGR